MYKCGKPKDLPAKAFRFKGVIGIKAISSIFRLK
jgi:hypothetical protein